jgi:hypothetical protein
MKHAPLTAQALFGHLITVFPLLFCACGTSGGSEEDPELLRVIHAAPEVKEIEVVVGDEPPEDDETTADTARIGRSERFTLRSEIVFGPLKYQGVSEYSEVLEDTALPFVVKRPTSVGALLSEEQTIGGGKTYTYVVYEEESVVKSVLQEDDLDSPKEGKFRLRAAHFAASQDAVDLYIYDTSSRLVDSEPAVTALAFKSFSDGIEIDAGRYEIKFTETGTKDVIDDIGILDQKAGNVLTLIFFDKKGGGSPESKLYIDRAS